MNELKLLGCATGIFVFFLQYGVIIDSIYQTKFGPSGDKFHYSMVLTFAQAVVNVLFAWLMGAVLSFFSRHDKIEEVRVPPKVKDDFSPKLAQNATEPWWQSAIIFYSIPSICQVCANYFGNLSLEHIDVPTKELAKTLKPVPVLVMGALLFRQHHNKLQWLSVALVCAGVAIFVNESTHSKQDSITSFYGFGLTAVSLLFDGFVGTTQDSLSKKYKPSSSQLMLYTNFWATLSSFIGIFVTGEAFTAIEFIRKYPQLLYELVYLALMSACGQTFIFLTIKEFGSLKNSLITTTRKFLQVLLNTFYFGRSLSAQKWVAVLIVFVGVICDRYGDYVEKKSKHDKTTSTDDTGSGSATNSRSNSETKKLQRKKAD